MQRFTVYTLIDITETKKYRHTHDDSVGKYQQQNFLSLVQTIGMRANPLYMSSPTIEETDVSSYSFGNSFKGKHKVWSFSFSIEYDDAFNDGTTPFGLLAKDLHFVPIIVGLDETAEFTHSVFDTKTDSDRNMEIVFHDDK